MTENQQRIISHLIAEFNSRNEAKAKRPFKLIDVDELDSINQRHLELTADAERSKQSWKSVRAEYIAQLIGQIKEDLGDRLCVMRGDEAMENTNYSDSIFIYKYGTERHSRREEALRFDVKLHDISRLDGITQKYYEDYTGLYITRYASGNDNRKYKDEVEFFNCQYTKNKLKELLS